jgi:cyclophilin family peptidyl-prolyl cis-trans isomerase
MPRSRRFRKNDDKPEWGKNNPQTKAKNKQYTLIFGVIIVAVVVVSALLVVGGVFNAAPAASPSPSATPTATPSSSPTATPVVTPQPVATPATSPAGEYSTNGTRILFETSMGNITIQMRNDKPITTANFINITQSGLFDNTVFHRIMAGFMIQGGGVSGNVPSISDEIGNDNQNNIGTIAMAKTSDPNSATSQFFINVANNGNNVIDQAGTRFDTVYTVFGKVIGGMDVVNAIANVPVTANPYTGENSQPVNAVTLIRATVLS